MRAGLSTAEVTKRRHKYGANVLTASQSNPWWKMLLSQFTDLMVIILIVSALIAVAFGYIEGEKGGLIDGAVILGIVLLNAAIGFFQEFKAEKAIEALKKLVAPHAIVIRDGKKQQINAESIVPGDLVVLTAGDKIPADGILLESSEFKAEESALTGESVPVHKKESEQVFMGTSVASGSGLMEVKATGMETAFGRIAHLTTKTVQDYSPLQKEMFHIGVFVTKVTLLISTILVLTGVFVQGKHFLESLLFAVSVAVAAVPEGLPATITVALALGVQKMVKKNAVVKKLSSIETLGSTSVICSDKTGTLTKNEMTVTRILLGKDGLLPVGGTGYDPNKGSIGSAQESLPNPLAKNLEMMRQIGQYCTEATLQKKGKTWSILGDPTEGALITLAQKKAFGSKKKPTLKKNKLLHELPFDSNRKMMSVVVQQGANRQLWTKGSPDAVIKQSKKILLNGELKAFTPAMKKKVQQHYQAMAKDALRVIAFAYREKLSAKESTAGHKTLEKNLIFVGLAGMIDPPRQAVPGAVKMCHTAGIRTIIVTGDYGLTAKAIAKEVHIATEETPVVLGEELEKMTDRQLDKLLKVADKSIPLAQQSLIFSRVNPEHKRRIVDRLKRMGEIVAVTGDGVNDAPALKRADLGIAMGITGTEVSKETANMILLDDSFASIVTAVREGRKIYANLKKFTYYVFSSNIGELLAIFSSIIFQTPAPLTASLILAIDLGTDILPGIALGVDHAEPDVMDHPPRNQNERIMNPRFLLHLLYFGFLIGGVVVGLFWWKLSQIGWQWGETLTMDDMGLRQAVTLAFASLVYVQLFNAFNARSKWHSVFRLRSLWQLWAAFISSSILVIAIVHVPVLQVIFKTTDLSFFDWSLVVGGGVVVLMAEELRKLLTNRWVRAR